jgi:hypothetical protein
MKRGNLRAGMVLSTSCTSNTVFTPGWLTANFFASYSNSRLTTLQQSTVRDSIQEVGLSQESEERRMDGY